MHYEGNIIRPPSEADSILMQVTVGCSHNHCTFCGTYKGERFRVKDEPTIMADIAYAAKHCQSQTRLFLCDGDAMTIPQDRLLKILVEINHQLPWVTRIGTYANAKNLQSKSQADLETLKTHGLGIVYLGLESGDDETLLMVDKRVDSAAIIEQSLKVRQAGIKLSITVILGLAGPERSHIHAQRTGAVLSVIDPEYVGALSLMLIPGTPMYADWKQGTFSLQGPKDMLAELRTMIAHTHLSGGLFTANHASNYLPIKAHLPGEKVSALKLIDMALQDDLPLKPEWLRAL
jgi:radical SAM superfamily enzyme YgiQ (UPF0313 family)